MFGFFYTPCSLFGFDLDEMEKLNSALRQDIVKLRGTVKSLDIEKDNLQQQVDEKTERVMALDARRLKQVRNKIAHTVLSFANMT